MGWTQRVPARSGAPNDEGLTSLAVQRFCRFASVFTSGEGPTKPPIASTKANCIPTVTALGNGAENPAIEACPQRSSQTTADSYSLWVRPHEVSTVRISSSTLLEIRFVAQRGGAATKTDDAPWRFPA